jgi:hypothetical protein
MRKSWHYLRRQAVARLVQFARGLRPQTLVFSLRWISSLTVGIWRSLRITVFGTLQGASTIMRKAFDWKCSRISVLEVEAVP